MYHEQFEFAGTVVLVTDEATCDTAFQQLASLLIDNEQLIVGLDTEHVAYMNSLSLKYDHKFADIVQICPSEDLCILVYFKKDKDPIYAAMRAFLSDDRYVKVDIYIQSHKHLQNVMYYSTHLYVVGRCLHLW